MRDNLRKDKLVGDKSGKYYVSDVYKSCIYSYCTEKSTGKVYAYYDFESSVVTLDSNGMPDEHYMNILNTEDFNKFDFGDRENPNYIPWPKGVKEPKGKRFG